MYAKKGEVTLLIVLGLVLLVGGVYVAKQVIPSFPSSLQSSFQDSNQLAGNQLTGAAIFTVQDQANATQCGDVRASLTLTNNINSSGTCLTVNASNIVINCAGREINYSYAGTQGNGILNNGYPNVTVKNCVIKEGTSAGSGKQAILFNVNSTGSAAHNGTIYNNTIITVGTQGVGILVTNVNQTNISTNNVTTSGSNAGGIGVTTSSENTIAFNIISTSAAGAGGIVLNTAHKNLVLANTVSTVIWFPIDMYAFVSADNNVLINNTLQSTLNFTIMDARTSSTVSNQLVYTGTFGQINWTRSNLTTNVNLSMGTSIFLANRTVGFIDSDQAFNLNGTAQIEIRTLQYPSAPILLKAGRRCDGTPACNITYTAATGILYANVSSFSNYTTNGAPTHNRPVLNTTNIEFNDTNVNVTLYFQNVSDVDQDSIKNITNWLLNGTSIMVLNMPFEGINGTTNNNARDYSGNERNGTEGSGVLWNSTGGFDGRGAYKFDGIDDFINISYSAALNITSSITIESWIKTSFNRSGTTQDQADIIFTHGSGDNGYQLALIMNNSIVFCGATAGKPLGTIQFSLQLGASQICLVSNTSIANDTAFHHVTGTYNGSLLRVYLDGVLAGERENSGSIINSAVNAYIGSTRGGTLIVANATIDEVRLYNRSLSLQQIQAIYNNKTNLIVLQELSSGQNWTADVTLNDGKMDGATARSNQVIIVTANSAPIISSLVLNTTDVTKNDTNQNLTLYINVSDADGDSIKNITNWLLNGTSMMVLNMPFERINGTTTDNAWDYSGYGNNGNETNGVLWNSTGGFDGRGAYEFDGIDDSLKLPVTPSLLIGGNRFTAEAWMKMKNSSVSYNCLLALGNSTVGQDLFNFCSYANTYLYVSFWNGTANTELYTSLIPPLDGQYHHFVGVYNSTNLIIYRDGQQVGLGSATGNLALGLSSAARIGNGVRQANVYNGTIDEVRFYNRSLTAQQILALFNNKTNLIVSQELRPAENWTAIVYPNDGKVDGAFARSNQVLVLNTPPVVSSLVLNTTDITKNDTNQNLTLYVTASDADGDSIKNITNWLLNGTNILIFNVPMEGINGTSSNNALDYAGRDVLLNFSEIGAPYWNATGGYDGRGAYSFNNSADYLISNYRYNPGTGNFSIEFRLKTSETGVNHVPVAIWDGGNADALVFGVGTTDYSCTVGEEVANKINFILSNRTAAGQKDFCLNSSTSVNDGTWHHIVAVRNNDNASLYVDGSLESSQLGLAGEDYSPVSGITIGTVGASWYINATVDELRVWNRSLTAQQILALYNNKTNLIVSQELLPGQNWTADVTPNDGRVDGSVVRSRQLIVTRDIQAPNISAVASSLITTSAATITWSTDEDANSTVQYGISLALGSVSSSTSRTTSQSVGLSGLDSRTVYYYNVTSCDIWGNCNTTGSYNFETATPASTVSESSGASTVAEPVATTPTVTSPVVTTPTVPEPVKPVVAPAIPVIEVIATAAETKESLEVSVEAASTAAIAGTGAAAAAAPATADSSSGQAAAAGGSGGGDGGAAAVAAAPVESRTPAVTETVSVTFTNKGTKTIELVPTVEETLPSLPNEEKVKETLKESIVQESAQTGGTITEEEIRQKVEEGTELLQHIEEQNVQYLIGKTVTVGKVIAARKGLRELQESGLTLITGKPLYGLSGITYSGERITGRLLKTQLLGLEKIRIPPGGTIQKELVIQRGLALKPKEITVAFTSQGTTVSEKSVVSEEVITGGAVDVDPVKDSFDVYFVIPSGQPAGEYSMELGIEKDMAKDHALPVRLLFNLIGRSRLRVQYAEWFGPFDVEGQGYIFAQQFSYDETTYKGDFSIVLRIYRNGTKVAEQRYPVTLG